jgi:hypothetical protein
MVADHRVTLSRVPRLELSRADVEFRVRTDDVALGTLKISRGSVVWTPANNKKFYYELSWADFDQLMQTWGRHEPS